MPHKLFWISMTDELWCLVVAEVVLNILAVLIWFRQRRAPRARATSCSIAVLAAVPASAVLAFAAGAGRAFFPASGPPSETARDLAIGILTMMHAIWLWVPFLIGPLVAYSRVRSLAAQQGRPTSQ